MTGTEDTLKAVEALAEIVRDWVSDPDPEMKVQVLKRLDGLRLGCGALRMGRRGSEFARMILERPEPELPPQ